MKTEADDPISVLKTEYPLYNPNDPEDIDLGFMIEGTKTGLTKREYFATHLRVDDIITFTRIPDVHDFLQRKIDYANDIEVAKARLEVEAKLRVMFADALIMELNKQA